MSEEILDFEATKETKTVSVWKNGLLFGLLALFGLVFHFYANYFMPVTIEGGDTSSFRTLNLIRSTVGPILFYCIISSGMIRLAIRNNPRPNLLKQVAFTGFIAYQTSWITIMVSSLVLGGFGFNFSFDSIPQILAANIIIFIGAVPISRIPNALSKLKNKRHYE